MLHDLPVKSHPTIHDARRSDFSYNAIYMRRFLTDKKAWGEFLVIAFLLALALGLAMGSSIGLRQGNALLSKALALLSLIIAAVVTIAYVPRLAHRVTAAGTTLPGFGITQAGGLYLIIILVIALAALNTGNNLLFLVLSVLLAAIVSSGVMARLSLKGISVSLQVPEHISVGDVVPLRVTLKNHKRFVSSFSLAVCGCPARSVSALHRMLSLLRRRRQRDRFSANRPETLDAKLLLQHPVYFSMVPRGESVSQAVMHIFPARGCYTLNGFRISTCFPFGFFTKSQRITAQGQVVVYPRIYEVNAEFQGLPFWNGLQPSPRRGHGEELYAYRLYRPGDDARFVDWKATAKVSQLIMKDFTCADERRVTLFLDTRCYKDTPSFAEQFENAVSLTASLVTHFIQEEIEVELGLPEQMWFTGWGQMQLYRILELLARVEPSHLGGSSPGTLDQWIDAGQAAGYPPAPKGFMIIITSLARAEVAPSVTRRARVIHFDEITR
ncbi:MAG: DUF58 domain-containing protein [Acidobacteria bacterium]|nr:DUF58 domain-containing protein [Acidobacteriota bacterium]MBI3655243.1 DUF58 domain-containing protein [Acidobacteriota bacterium]